MLLGERRSRILHTLADGGVTVRELAVSIGVSESTIRRDLSYLDDRGSLERTYGGALPTASADVQQLATQVTSTVTDDGGEEGDFDLGRDRAVRTAVAEAAAAMVSDHSVIILDIGTTTPLIARRLRGRPVTVITSSVAVLDELRDDDQVQLILLGGVLRRNYRSLVGPLTEAGLQQMSADLMFLSCTGVRASGQVVDNMAVEVPIKQSMINAADRVIVLAPATKFPGTGALRLCTLSDVAGIVTTEGAPAEPLQRCRDAGAEVVIV